MEDAQLILTKNAILQKVNELLSNIHELQKEHLASLSHRLPADLFLNNGKIAKGENYQGLPYRMLDYPAFFKQDNILAIRTMFWWGHFFSITLHISGDFKSMMEKRLLAAFDKFDKQGLYCSTSDDQWHHDLESTNYALVNAIGRKAFEQNLREKDFIKLAYKIPLKQWDKAEDKLVEYFKGMTSWLKN